MNSLNVEMFNEALKLEKQQNWGAALELYDEILKEKPDHFETWLNRGAIYFKKENQVEAIKSYEQAILLKKDIRVFYNLGLVFFKSKKWDLALKNFLECIKINGSFLPACLLTGYIFTEQNKPDDAIKILQDALLIHKENESLLLSLALAHQLKKNDQLCISIIENILKKNPKNKAALRLKARFSIKEKVTKSSIMNFKSLIKEDADLEKMGSLFEKAENSSIKESVLKRKDEIIYKSSKTNNDYLDLSLISLLTGNGDAAMNYLLYAVKA